MVLVESSDQTLATREENNGVDNTALVKHCVFVLAPAARVFKNV